jgi:hypothetical protein
MSIRPAILSCMGYQAHIFYRSSDPFMPHFYNFYRKAQIRTYRYMPAYLPISNGTIVDLSVESVTTKGRPVMQLGDSTFIFKIIRSGYHKNVNIYVTC